MAAQLKASTSEEVGIQDTLDLVTDIETRSYKIIQRLREVTFAPDHKKQLKLRFTITEAAKMIGKSSQLIRNKEKSGELESPSLSDTQRRTGYTLAEINKMRDHFGTRPKRADSDDPAVLAVSTFKGGAGKSTITLHLAHYFGLKGYRVCVIDCDPQGSLTLLFGINPDFDLDRDDTLLPFLAGDTSSKPGVSFKTLKYAVRKTHWPNIDIIPANLHLDSADFALSARRTSDGDAVLSTLKRGIKTISQDYDIILIDPPPALGLLPLSVLRAANALLVPVQPSNVDFASTAHFFTMLRENLETLAKQGLGVSYNFIKVLISRSDDRKQAHLDIARQMELTYQKELLRAKLKDTADIDNAAFGLMSILELTRDQANPEESHRKVTGETHRRAIACIKAIGAEVELEIRRAWPSHHQSLSAKNLL